MTCTLHTNDVVNEYTLDATYVVTYRNDLVYNVESTEIIKSNSSKVIDYFNDYVTNTSPNPLQQGQAPCGELNEKLWGAGSL